MVRISDKLQVDLDRRLVLVQAEVCLRSGWLEQVACGPSTREHESILVIDVPPSQIHAALMMAGFKPGAPGSWSYDNDQLTVNPPTGPQVNMLVRPSDEPAAIPEPLGAWVRNSVTGETLEDATWTFAGSFIIDDARARDLPSRYAADMSGSIIGLVTFGDEMLAYPDVRSESVQVDEAIWQCNTEAIPEEGTGVTIILSHPGK
ncbi:MAG: hypothetical protein CMJ32_12115 [Phycisphaerae bacterium]|nr:hypothetical protein [Phycisphaerae bacterium]